jgi:hypothetical protein
MMSFYYYILPHQGDISLLAHAAVAWIKKAAVMELLLQSSEL